MSHEPSGKNLGEFFGEYSKTKDTIAQVLAALSRGIADLIRKPFKGLKNKLISLIAILLLLFNPLSDGIVGFIFKQIFKIEISEIGWYKEFLAWWPYLFAGAVLLALTIMVWEQLTRKPLPPVQFRNPAIKGLLSFEQADAEIFKKLQRETDVQQVLSALTHQNFRFGVLTGVSGCGKSSLLKAGLLPALAEQNRRVVIATLTDEPPLESVQKALTSQLGVHFKEDITNLRQMLDAVSQVAGGAGFILILDQFEQFFTQNRTEESREPFIKELWNAYLNADGAKILLSIRLDFMGRLHEIQQRLQYNLTADQNYFNLRKFKPEQVVRIFRVMSDEGKMETFDEDFILRMTKEELASHEDGLVSAADVQWVATALQQAEGFAFDEKTFRQNGGVQGMMQQYLQKLLETPNAFNLQQEALKVLLAFVDLDNNTRKGRLSATDLHQNLGDQISRDHLTSNLEWLTQNRLLHRPGPGKTESENPVWELAHERLIEPLRALANKALSGLDRANLLLNRRVNEWLANGKASRFLLTRKEYYSFRKNAQYLVIEPNKSAKEDLFSTSRKRVEFWNRVAAAVLVLLLAVWGVYETTWFKVEVLAKGDIERIIESFHVGKSNELLAMLDSLSKVNSQQALDIVEKLSLVEKQTAYKSIWDNMKNNILEDSIGRKKTLESLVAYLSNATFVEMADSLPPMLLPSTSKTKNTDIIQQITESANKIGNECNRTEVFRNLAESAVKIGDSQQGFLFLQQAERSAQKIMYEHLCAEAFCTLAQSAAKMGNSQQGLLFLQQAEQSAQKIKNEYYRVQAFCAMAETAAKMGDFKQGLLYLKQAEQSMQKVKDDGMHAEVFRTLATSTAQMDDSQQGLQFLQQLEQSAKEIKSEFYRIRVFRPLAESAVKIGDSLLVLLFWQQLELSAQKLKDDEKRAIVFRALAETAAKIGDSLQVLRFLKQSERSAKEIMSLSTRAWIFITLAECAAKMGDYKQGLQFLQQAEQSAQKIGDKGDRARVFGYLAESAAKMDDSQQGLRFLQQAEQSAQKISDKGDRAEAFSALAECAAKMGDSETMIGFLAQLDEHITEFEPKSEPLAIHFRALSQAYADLGEYRKAYALADRIEDKYPEKVFALIHLQKRYKERK